MASDKITEELYQALKSMSESYKITIQNFPAGVARSSVEGFFLHAPKQASDAIIKFEVLKERKRVSDSDFYMANILKGTTLPQ